MINKNIAFVSKKMMRLILLLLGVSILSFLLLKYSPVDPVMASVDYDTSLTPEQYKKIAEYYGLDKPIITQYFIWLKNFITGNFGTSLIYRKPVIDIINERVGASVALMGISWILSGVIGFVLGTLAAFRRGKIFDRVIKLFSYLQASVPTFWIGLINSEYVTFAKARGENNFEIFKNHCIRNAIVPAITLHFSYFGELFGGSVLAEQVFSYPGLGSTLTQAGLKGDSPLLLAIVIIGAIFVFVGNMLADILNGILNPNLRR